MKCEKCINLMVGGIAHLSMMQLTMLRIFDK
jgi:hypothetical protein